MFVLLSLFLVTQGAQAKYRYRLTNLEPYGFTGADARAALAINNLGQVVGRADGKKLLFFDGTRTIEHLLPLDGTVEWVAGGAVNDAGQIAGTIAYLYGPVRSFLYSGDSVVDLGVVRPTDTLTRPTAINGLGQVAGFCAGPEGRHGFLFSGGILTDIGTLGEAFTEAYAINRRGQIVGNSMYAAFTPTHAFLYEEGRMKDLGTLGGERTGSYAWAINDAGVVTGEAETVTKGVRHPFVYSAGRMVDIDPDVVSVDGIGNSADAINNYGVIVGMANNRSAIWSGGVKMSLDSLVDFAGTGLQPYVNNPVAINDRGEILAYASDYGVTGAKSILLTPLPASGTPGRLVNISARCAAGSGDQTSIAGFVVGGGASGTVLVRTVGPTLRAMGVGTGAIDPSLTLFDHKPEVYQRNNDWGQADNAAEIAAAAVRVGAFVLPDGSKDAATLVRLPAGPYTVHAAATDTSQIVLSEVYDASGDADAHLVNASIRVPVGKGDAIGILGFVIAGDNPVKVLIRAVGPSLAAQGVGAPLADPQLWLHLGSRAFMGNDDWGSVAKTPVLAAAMNQVGAFALPNDSKDAALLIQLEPGVYTVLVSGVGETTGVALIELYLVP